MTKYEETSIKSRQEVIKDEVKKLQEKALEKIKTYTKNPKDLLELAKFMSNFSNYSAKNMELINTQFRGAYAVGSFKDFSNAGFKVNKGEKAMKIWIPYEVTTFTDRKGEIKRISQATKEEKELIKVKKLETKKSTYFTLKAGVFDVSQTNATPEDLPKIFPNKVWNFEMKGQDEKFFNNALSGLAKSLKIDVSPWTKADIQINPLKEIIGSNARGFYRQNSLTGEEVIKLNPNNTQSQNVAVTIHELAHKKLHNRFDDIGSKLTKEAKEFEAELTSYVVCKHYGMDTEEEAIPYIAKWTNNGKLEDLQQSIDRVHKVASSFIKEMDKGILHDRHLEKENSIDKKEIIEKVMKGEETPYGRDFYDVITIDDIKKEIKEPCLLVEWGEGSEEIFKAGKVYNFDEAKELFDKAEKYYSSLEYGYSKTKFHLFYNRDGKLAAYINRVDFGDGEDNSFENQFGFYTNWDKETKKHQKYNLFNIYNISSNEIKIESKNKLDINKISHRKQTGKTTEISM